MSTGLGRLHFVAAAEHLQNVDVNLEVVQGWVPQIVPAPIIDAMGKLINSKYLSVGLALRRMPFLDASKIHSCAYPEFLTQFLFVLNRANLISRGRAAAIGWSAFGSCSKKYLDRQSIFHVRSGAGRGGAIARAKRLGIKVITDHSIAHPKFLESALRDEFESNGIPFWMSSEDPFWSSVIADCKECDVLLVNSQFVKDTFVDQGHDPDQIEVVHFGVREDFLFLKKDYAISSKANLLFTGGFGFRKGAQYLLPAMAQLNQTEAASHLTVVGAFEEARPLIQQQSSVDCLTFTGFIPQDELKDRLAAADIYIFPSLAEGCASSGMEAMAAGLPVIATRESGLPIRHMENGFLVPSKSIEGIVTAVKRLASDRQLREHLGRNAAETISQHYTWKHYGENVARVYRSLNAGS